jgi:hypothetical protein
VLTCEQLLSIDRKLRQVRPRRSSGNHDRISLNVPRRAIRCGHRNRLPIPQRSSSLHMFNIPRLEERRDALHESRHDLVLSCNHPCEIVPDWTLDE